MGLMRIFIASPDDRLRLALIMFLDDEPGMSVVGISNRLTGLLTQLQGAEPDVLLLDGVLPTQSIVHLLTDLHNLELRPETIILSSRMEDNEAMVAAGADHIISKDTPPDDLKPILNDIRLYRDSFKYKER